MVDELSYPGVTETRASRLKAFLDTCLSANVDMMKQYLEKNPEFVLSEATPKEAVARLQSYDAQPVDWTLNPRVLTVFLQSTYPAYALHLAAGNGHSDLAKLLVEAGVKLGSWRR